MREIIINYENGNSMVKYDQMNIRYRLLSDNSGISYHIFIEAPTNKWPEVWTKVFPQQIYGIDTAINLVRKHARDYAEKHGYCWAA